ncbi:unnamed protein product, partial [Iphiclides podalirius]
MSRRSAVSGICMRQLRPPPPPTASRAKFINPGPLFPGADGIELPPQDRLLRGEGRLVFHRALATRLALAQRPCRL